MSRLKFVVCCAITVCKLLWSPEHGAAAGEFNLPLATELSAGDLLINDAFEGWIKFDPTSNQLYALDWPKPSSLVTRASVEADGAILLMEGESLRRIHPVTGNSTLLNPARPITPGNLDYTLLPDGDLLLHRPASSARREGDVWSGGFDSVFIRYDRETGMYLPTPKPRQFSPYSVVAGDNGEVYVDDFFRGIQQIDLATGNMSDYPPQSGWQGELIGAYPNGDLALFTRFEGISRVDLAAGTDTPVSSGNFFPFSRIVMEDDGDFWSLERNSLFFIDGATGERTARATPGASFAPRSLLLIPSDWTPPPVPEPSTLVLALAAGGAGIALRRSRRSTKITEA